MTKGADGKPVDDLPSPQHNMAARASTMRECAAGLDSIDLERSELNESAAEIRKRLKDNGISTKELDTVRRLRKMGADDRDTVIDNLREALSALGVGRQGQLFPEDSASVASAKPEYLGADTGQGPDSPQTQAH